MTVLRMTISFAILVVPMNYSRLIRVHLVVLTKAMLPLLMRALFHHVLKIVTKLIAARAERAMLLRICRFSEGVPWMRRLQSSRMPTPLTIVRRRDRSCTPSVPCYFSMDFPLGHR